MNLQTSKKKCERVRKGLEHLLSGKRWHGRGRPGLGLGKHFGGEEPEKSGVLLIDNILRRY